MTEGISGASSETAFAKINLALHVRRREADGYHAIETVFAFCEDGDRLTIHDQPGLTMAGPFASALGEDDNLVLRAERAFAARFASAPAGFALDKHLPVAAGLGGGSADAAAALRLLCRRDGIDAADPAITDLAAGLGADVPACLMSRLARGEGRGDRITPFDAALSEVPVLLVNPGMALSTGAVFAAWDRIDRGPLGEGATADVARQGRNDLEAAARTLCPAIGELLAVLASQPGVWLARMSGSGATCFALFDDATALADADAAVARTYPAWWRMATRLR